MASRGVSSSQLTPAASSSMDTEEDYGLIRPSLIKQLRSILDQYPDDGQILKELIQNAEDAGASEMKLLYDQHSYGTESLHHPGLAQYQGPALYSYNNGLFEEKDWTGIRMLQDSVKEKDPLKVGRFGLGFKSVLHMTDLPSVLSGDRLFMIDPHEKYFQYKGDRTSGYSWHLRQKKDLIRSLSDQFQPFKGIFGSSDKTFDHGFFQGTLFRFPLRKTVSELSDTVYCHTRMQDLFQSFQADAQMLLTFLKNLERVQLYERDASASEPELLFEISIAPECLDYVRKKRKEFLDQVKLAKTPGAEGSVSVTYAIRTVTVKFSSAKVEEKTTHQWFVNEYHAGPEGSAQLTQLMNDPKLSLEPLVGVAMEIGANHKGKDGKVADADTTQTRAQAEMGIPTKDPEMPHGQVYCFLPLPVEQQSPTGLPVHVNGYFAISQNRRHLKWPTAGQKTQSDKSVWWNKLLLQEVLPRSYIQLILQACDFSKRNPTIITPEDVYNAIPNLVYVDEKWQVVLEPLFIELFTQPIVHTLAGGGQWIEVQDAVFDCMREEKEAKKLIVDILLESGVSVAKVPVHMLNALGAYSRHSPEIITPALVRDMLQTVPQVYLSRARPESLVLLKYIMKDEDFRELISIKLLPLANGAFGSFDTGGEAIYIPSHESPRNLFPGLGVHLLADDLDDHLKSKLCKLADEGTTQLRHMSKQSAAMLIPKVIPREWYQQEIVTWTCSDDAEADPTSLTYEWLAILWDYLRKQYPRDISHFCGIPIFPLNSTPPLKLVPLSMSGTAVLKSAVGTSLDDDVVHVLQILGVHVIEDLPEYVQNHAAVMGNFVNLPFIEDTLEAMFSAYKRRASAELVEDVRSKTNPAEKEALLQFLLTLKPGQIKLQHLKFLRSLPLFKVSDMELEGMHYVSVNEVSMAANLKELPFSVKGRFLDVSDEVPSRAAKLLGATFVSAATVLQENVFPELKSGTVDAETVEKVISHIFANYTSYSEKDPSMLHCLSEVPFIPTSDGHLRRPGLLFDPESTMVKELFQDQDVFPVGPMAEADKLVYLRKLGLKSEKDIKCIDIVHCMLFVEGLSLQSEIERQEMGVSKGTALLKFLNKSPEMLLKEIDSKPLIQWASNISWVPVLTDKPSLFPDSLPWCKGERIQNPKALRSLEWTPVAGSVQPMVLGNVHTRVASTFGWSNPPDAKLVVEQLRLLIQCFTPPEKAKYLALLTSVYDFLLQRNPKEVLDIFWRQKLEKWIWFGDGFTSLDKLVLNRPWLDLTPYMYTLPSEMRPFADLFLQCGMRKSCGVNDLVEVLHQMQRQHSQREHSDIDMVSTQRDLQLSIDLLNYMKDQALTPEQLSQILVPVHRPSSHELHLLPVDQSTYCDTEWVRQGFDLMEFNEQDGITFIHPNLPTGTAESLGVPTLMSRMLHAEELAITGFGQGEPLTKRLKNLLQDYTDGLSIFKELVQNADDAGATEVKFMYDERTNEDSMKYLIDEGMRECQGPSLWAFNNAAFTDTDFQNITKLGGATKEEEPDKIGKFGLGFNSVYNITDVPSFISRDSIVIFDPHTTHLGKGIKDRARPGIRINMQRNKTLLRKLPDQFRPYQGVFGCDIEPDKGCTFDGTLFRMPLRTRNQASRSEICNMHYDREQMTMLMRMLQKHAHNILLFTQNVTKITVQHLVASDDPRKAEDLFIVIKDIVEVIRELPSKAQGAPADGKGTRGYAFLRAAANYMKETSRTTRKRVISVPEVPRSSMVLKTCMTSTGNGNLGLQGGQTENLWLVSASVGQENSLSLAKAAKEPLVPAGSVAFALKRHIGSDSEGRKKDRYVPIPVEEVGLNGQVFCYLPLPIHTGLPVHINGLFAVESSRRHLSQMTEDDKQAHRAEWNEALLEDAVMHAYVQGLSDMQKLFPTDTEVALYDVWPSGENTDKYFQPVVRSFYKNVSSLMRMPIYVEGDTIVLLESAVFMDPEFAKSKVGKVAMEAYRQSGSKFHILAPPASVMASFEVHGHSSLLQEKTLNMHRFYKEVFFENIEKLQADARDILVLFALKQNDPELDNLLGSHACIPVTPDGSRLCMPGELISPTGVAAKLYVAEDGRFPYGEAFVNGNTLGALQRLGLKVNDLDWPDIVERARSVSHVSEALDGKARLHNVLAFIDRKLLQSTKHVKSFQQQVSHEYDSEPDQAREELQHIAFLSLLPKPAHFPLIWKGDSFGNNELFCPGDLFSKETRHLVCTTQPIADEMRMAPRVRDFLGLTTRRIDLEMVMTQMEHALRVDPMSLSVEQFEELQKTLYYIYDHLQGKLATDKECAKEACEVLKDKPCILIGATLVRGSQVATSFVSNCSPYLYGLPPDLAKRFGSLMQGLGVRDTFEPADFTRSLHILKEENRELPLKDKQLDLSVRLVTQLNWVMRRRGLSAEEVREKEGVIYVPNVNGILQPSDSLCYNDCPWVTETKQMNFTHPDITFKTSAHLGVRTKREEALSRHAKGIPFGQKEGLTNSLKRILDGYPCDMEIFKELIQNADDAKATEIHFIRDPRNHPDKRVFENSWKPLQGPALCVYNNKPFAAADLEGIQRLGEGSKREDPSRTGQYGIGFSSVYHLTDVPSVLSSGSELGKTLCVFDPHCHFVPGATTAEPGMRYDNVDELKAAFPDVFAGYLEDVVNMKNATVFRFPLRSMQMAERSQISNIPISISRVKSLLDKLKMELFEILLFTNYIEQISISDIEPISGKLVNTYTVKSALSRDNHVSREELATCIKENAQKLRSGELTLKDIPSRDSVITMFITDNAGRQEKWRVSNVLGFDPDVEIPDAVVKAFNDRDLMLMPRGGAACLLEQRYHSQIEQISLQPKRAFCFLPLPLETKLPVHINGHFALGYENRRHIWTSADRSAYKKEWNDFLCNKVIARAYCALLLSIRMQGFTCETSADVDIIRCTRKDLNIGMKSYMDYYPSFNDTNTDWNELVKAVYQTIAENHMPVLPSLRECPDRPNAGASAHDATEMNPVPTWQVLWLPPKGEGSNKAFFSDFEEGELRKTDKSLLKRFAGWFKTPHNTSTEKSDSQILKEVLLDCGFKLIEATPNIVDNLQTAGIEIDFMSPDGVITFYRTFDTETPACSLGGQLPLRLVETPFKTEQNLSVVLKYCKNDPDFLYKLEGLPLLLTSDGYLRLFDSDVPIFCTYYQDLVPDKSDLFMKNSMKDCIFNFDDLSASPVFREFNIASLAEIIHHRLPEEEFKGAKEPKEWVKTLVSVPNEVWLRRVWQFLRSECDDIITKAGNEKSEVDATIADKLQPLSEWCLLPAKEYKKTFLVPLNMGDQVVHFGQTDYKHYSVRETLRKLHMMELDSLAINSDTAYNVDVAKTLVTSLERPRAVLKLLSHKFGIGSSSIHLAREECERILEYLCEHIEELQNQDPEEVAQMLLDLPLYTTICGDVIRLTKCIVYILPAKIPTNGIDVWQSQSGTVFLERSEDLQALYDFLGCATISAKEVYCQFILQHFEFFPMQDRMVHLHHVYSKYLISGSTEIPPEGKEELLQTLKSVPIIECGDGSLELASEFYDPDNLLFRVMLPEDKFPPRASGHFKESEWYTFLGELGLIREVSKYMYVGFTLQVANEGRNPDSASALTKSKALTQHLFTMNKHTRHDILEDISSVPFVAPSKASVKLTDLFPQHGETGADKLGYVSFRDAMSKDYESLVWTSASLLPEWADPMKVPDMPRDEQVHVMDKLEIQKIPQVEQVISNLLNLCDQLSSPFFKTSAMKQHTLLEVFKEMYRFLQEHPIDEDAQKILANRNCILVDDGRKVVRPNQTVHNMYEEIRPYLYKVPAQLGEFQRLFTQVGATDRVTIAQFSGVLECLKQGAGMQRLTPNELRLCLTVVKGLLELLEDPNTKHPDIGALYLPSETGRLVDANMLVFNDAPSYYDRVKDFGLQFLVDLKECGFRSRNCDELILALPQRMRPGMLSAFVKEELLDTSRKSASHDGLAKTLDKRIKSENFLKAVVRVIRHETHKSGSKVPEREMYEVLDRLSTINVNGINKVVTHLTFKGHPISGSNIERACFVEKIPTGTTEFCKWNMYIQDDSVLNQDLLVPLAEVINSILSGMLHDSVLYLLPIISCSEHEMQQKLDNLNVRLDHLQSTSTQRAPVLPVPGTEVSDEASKKWLKWGEVVFEVGEYVGYRQEDGGQVFYAIVQEEIMGPEEDHVYLIKVSEDQDAVIAQAAQLFKFQRDA